MSSRELIVRYLWERARLSVLVPLAAVMAAIGGWTGGQVNGWTGQRRAIEFALATVTALVLVLAFRVWDDLEDRSRDAREHPSRVTVVANSVRPLIVVALVLGVSGVLLVVRGPKSGARLAAIGAAFVILAVWYRLRRASDRAVFNAHVVLLKYPLLAFAATPFAPSLGALVALYLILCVSEVVDDRTLRASILARWIAISECALVSLIIATATILGRVP